MPYRGPSRSYDVPAASTFDRVMQLYQPRPALNLAPPSGGGVSRIDTDLMRMDDAVEAGKAQLAMTPGVRRGGSSVTRPQADSPLNVGASTSFTRFGDTYSYDPQAAAAQSGEEAATAQNANDKTRYTALLNTPGITPRQAARLVYGRGDILDTDPDELRRAIASYTRQPTREGAAAAIEAGAPASDFRLQPTGDEVPMAPVRGTPKYFDTYNTEQAIQSKYNMAERAQLTQAQADAERRADARAAAVDRRAAEQGVSTRRNDFQRTLRARPRQSQYVDPLTRQADTTSYNDAMTNFRADSTMSADALKAAQDHLRYLTGDTTSVAPPGGRGIDLSGDATESISGKPGLKPLTPKLMTWAKGDPLKKAYLAEQGYDVSQIP